MRTTDFEEYTTGEQGGDGIRRELPDKMGFIPKESLRGLDTVIIIWVGGALTYLKSNPADLRGVAF